MPEKFKPRVVDVEEEIPFKPRIVSIEDKDYSVEHPGLKEFLDPPEAIDYARHYGGRFVPDIIKAVGGGIGGAVGAGAGAVTGPGILASAAGGATVGAAGGSGLAQILQRSFPRLFGAGPEQGEGLNTTLTDALTYGAASEVGGRGVGKVLSTVGKLFNKGGRAELAAKLYKTSGNPEVGKALAQEQYKQGVKKFVYPESQIIDNLSKADTEIFTPTLTKSGIIDTKKSKVLNSVTDSLEQLKNGSIGYKDVSNFIFKDVSKVREANLIDPTATRQLAQNKIINSTYSGKTMTVNPSKALELLNGSDGQIYETALGKQQYQVMKDFFTEAKGFETSTSKADRIISFVKDKFTLALPGAIVGGFGGPAGSIVGSSASILLSNVAIKKLMSDPQTAKLALAALRTPAKNPASTLLTQGILASLRGTEVMIQAPDDKLQKAYVNDNGQLQYERPSN